MFGDVDWTQVVIVLLVVDALLVALCRLTGVNPLAPHTGGHTRKAVLSRPQAVDQTQPYALLPARERNRAGVV